MTAHDRRTAPPARPARTGPPDYDEALRRLDVAVCEGCAVLQAMDVPDRPPSAAQAARLAGAILAHGRRLMAALPRSRWASADYDDWTFGSCAGAIRSIAEGTILFHYLDRAATDEDTQAAVIETLRLHDLTKRHDALRGGGDPGEAAAHEAARDGIVARLTATRAFGALPAEGKRSVLRGRKPMLADRRSVLSDLGWDDAFYAVMWTITSNHVHGVDLALDETGPGGRGTGMETAFDRGFLAIGADVSAVILCEMTDALVARDPGAAAARRGTASVFAPGPPPTSAAPAT